MSAVATDESPRKRSSRLRRLLRYSAISLLAIIVLAFVTRRQIGNLLARQLDQQLAAAGVYVDWGAADLVPGPGIHFRKLALYRDAQKTDRIALLGNLTVRKGNLGWNQWTSASVEVGDSPLTLASGDLETTIENLNLDLHIRPGMVDLKEMNGTLQGLRLEASANYLSRDDAGEKPPESSAKPLADLDLGWLKQVKQWVKFEAQAAPPVLRVDYRSHDDGGAADVVATFDGQSFRWRGQQWDALQASAKTVLGDKPSQVVIESLHIGQAGKIADIAGSYDIASGLVNIDRLESTLDLLAVARAFSPNQGAGLANLSATGDWQFQGTGTIGVLKPDANKWNGSMAIDGKLSYASEKTRITLDNPACDLGLVASELVISSFNAGLWGGGLLVPMTRINLPVAESPPHFETQVQLEHARLESIMTSFGTAQKQPGTLTMDWSGSGQFALPTIKGSGSLAIHEAEFFRIPLLGPLHLVFDQISPGFGKDVASNLTGKHTLAESKLKIQNLHLDSKLTRIDANGIINLENNHANLAAQAQLQGLVGRATSLLSSLLELEGNGPISDIRWQLKNLPNSKMITGAARSVGKAGGSVIDGTGKALKSTGKAFKGLFRSPRK